MSHTNFLFHIVFATKDRLPLISPSWEKELYMYLAGIVKNHSGVPVAINGMPDHVHLLIRLSLHISFPDFMRELKASSSRWAKSKEPTFAWQRRYGAFSVSESACEDVADYIRKQRKHHLKRTFEREYMRLLQLNQIEFDERYLWE